MPQVDPEAARMVQPDLVSGESVVWAGRPAPGIVFHKEDLYLVPFSFMWGGFAIFWEAGVAGLWGHTSRPGTISTFMMLWGVPFIVIGQYMIWGRFLYAAWKKKRTFYAVTNRRIMVVQSGSGRRTSCAYLDTLPALIKQGGASVGTLRFSYENPTWSRGRGWQSWDSMAMGSIPALVDVEDPDSLYRLVAELREKAAARHPD